MNRDEINELAAVYALGALEGDDLARFEALLATQDPESLAALEAFEAALFGLAAAEADTPPSSVVRGFGASLPHHPLRWSGAAWIC